VKLPRASAIVSTVCGIGHFPFAPGTVMSAVAVPLAIVLALNGGWIAVAAGAVAASVFGTLAASQYVRGGHQDPSEIVVDELAGQWLACAFVSFAAFSLPAYFAAFALFRLFDIWKPWPVSWAEENFSGGIGVMADDLVAGLMAGLIAGGLHYFQIV